MRMITVASEAYDAKRDVVRLWVNDGLTRVGAVLGNGIRSNLAAVCWDVEVDKAVWDVMTLTDFECYYEPAFTRDLSRVAAVHTYGFEEDPRLSLFNLAGHTPPFVLSDGSTRPRVVTIPSALTLTADERYLIAARFEGQLRKGQRRKGCLRRWDLSDNSAAYESDWVIPLKARVGEYVTALAVSPDGRFVACGYDSGPVQLVRTASGRSAAEFQAGRDRNEHMRPEVKRLAFSPDGATLAVIASHRLKGKGGYKASVCDVPGGAAVTRFKETGSVNGLAFHPNGRTLLTARADGSVGVWDATTWKSTSSFDWKIGEVFSVAYSPDGLLAAAGGENGRIVVWDAEE